MWILSDFGTSDAKAFMMNFAFPQYGQWEGDGSYSLNWLSYCHVEKTNISVKSSRLRKKLMGGNKKPNWGLVPSSQKDMWIVDTSLTVLVLAAWEESGNISLKACCPGLFSPRETHWGEVIQLSGLGSDRDRFSLLDSAPKNKTYGERQSVVQSISSPISGCWNIILILFCKLYPKRTNSDKSGFEAFSISASLCGFLQCYGKMGPWVYGLNYLTVTLAQTRVVSAAILSWLLASINPKGIIIYQKRIS